MPVVLQPVLSVFCIHPTSVAKRHFVSDFDEYYNPEQLEVDPGKQIRLVASYIQKSSFYPTHAAPLIDDSHP